MKSRDVTPEEKRQWREATKRDKKFRAAPEEDPPPTVAPPVKESAAKIPTTPPPLPQKTAAPPRCLDARAAKKQLRAYGEVEATIDLHGFSRTEAFATLRDFIATSQRKGRRHLLIITGKGMGGAGVLKLAVPGWLTEPPLAAEVIALAPGSREKGGSGALHVIVRKR